MSVDQTNVIDAIGINNLTDEIILTIADHLTWDEEREHLLLLQEKFNAYLSFVESGELVQVYPDAQNRAVAIELVHKYPTNEQAEKFLTQASSIIQGADIAFRARLFTEE